MMWGTGHGLFGGVLMILFWGAIIALVILAIKWLMDRQGGPQRRDPMDTLRDRFAAGEIDEDEFERRRKTLER